MSFVQLQRGERSMPVWFKFVVESDPWRVGSRFDKDDVSLPGNVGCGRFERSKLGVLGVLVGLVGLVTRGSEDGSSGRRLAVLSTQASKSGVLRTLRG